MVDHEQEREELNRYGQMLIDKLESDLATLTTERDRWSDRYEKLSGGLKTIMNEHTSFLREG